MDISTLVTSTWTLIQPLLPIIAAKGAEEVGKRAVSEVWDLVKKRFESKEKTKEAITDLVQAPTDPDVQGAFRVQLKKLLEEDSAFAAELTKLLAATPQATYSATVMGDGAVTQGENAKAVGAGGIMIGGNVSGGVNVPRKKK